MTAEADTRLLINKISMWTKGLDRVPGWKEWRRKRIGKVISYGDGFDELESIGDFEFPIDLAKEHDVVMAFFALYASLNSLKNCEFYFRRYPFRGLPVDRHDHFLTVCEMYFGYFYQFKERLRILLNYINEIVAPGLDAGQLIKSYNVQFQSELKERNQIHHHRNFQSIEIEHIFMTHVMSSAYGAGEIDRGWKAEHRIAYRSAMNDWVGRVRRRAKAVELFLDAVASAMLKHCEFLAKC